jgi:hypothetical protein
MALVDFEKDLVVAYDLGTQPTYCYRIESYPYRNEAADAQIVAGTGGPNEQTIIHTICAKSLNEVCKQLKNIDLMMDVDTVCVWSNTLSGPYGGSNPSRENYGQYTEITDFCKNAECVDFCVAIKGHVNFTAISFGVTDNNQITGDGGGELVGSAVYYSKKNQYISSGLGMISSGTAPASQIGGIDGTAFIGSGGASMSGSGGARGSDLGTYVQDFGMDISSVELSTLGIPSQIPNNLVGFGGISRSDICDCKNVPYQIQLRHNLTRSSELTRFTNRNNIVIPTIVSMTYNEIIGCYAGNLRFDGISSFVNKDESWYISFNLYCTGELNQFANRYNWIFSSVIRRSTVDFNDSETSIIIFLSSDYICPSFSANNFNFRTNLNVQTLNLQVNNTIFVNSSNINDRLNLFLSSAWLANPVLSFSIGTLL